MCWDRLVDCEEAVAQQPIRLRERSKELAERESETAILPNFSSTLELVAAGS